MKKLTWRALGPLTIGLALAATACSGPSAIDEGEVASLPLSPAPAPGTTSNDAECNPLGARTSPLELFVQPDVGTAPFTDTINRATTSVDVMVYQMGFGPILDALEAKARAGVRVRVILDLAQQQVNERYRLRLVEAGAEVIWSDPSFTFMHAKVIIVDRGEALLSTGNYAASYMLRERNYAVRDTDPADVADLERIFESDFTRVAPDLSCTRLLVSPVNARERLLAFIGSATKTILVESMQLADRGVRDALAARKAAGVDVRAVLADPEWIDANAAAATFLSQHAIPARWIPKAHVKSILVDGKAAYVGSINLSGTSLTKNREVGLLVTEATNVDAIRTTFEKDWAIGTAF